MMAAAAYDARRDGAQVHSIWPRPDLSILTAGRRAPVTMPADPFGPLWPVVQGLAEAGGAPVDYVGLGVLVAAASLIGGKRRVKPYPTSDWNEPAILWGAVVGDPSSNKSPALDRVTDPLRTIEAEGASAFEEVHRAWQGEAQRAKAETSEWEKAVAAAAKEGGATPPKPRSATVPLEPTRRRPMVMDATPEAMGMILAGNPAGTLHLRDELAGWLEGFDRYTPGGRTYWLKAFGGRPYVVDRVKSPEPIRIPFNGVSVLGGIQPERLSTALLSGADDGLVARFLWAWPNKAPFRRPAACAESWRLEQAWRALDQLPWAMDSQGNDVAAVLELEPDAADLFDLWREDADADAEDKGSLYRGMAGKLPGVVLRLALVIELLVWADSTASEPRTVSLAAIRSAIGYAEEYQKPMALRVFGDAALPAVERNAATLGRYIQKHRPAIVNLREVRRTWKLPGLNSPDHIKEAVEWLVDASWLRPAPTRAGDTPGRARADYQVNPALMEKAA